MIDGVNKLLDATGKAIEMVPDLYDDSLKPTVQESGKIISIIPKTINAALVPLRKWIANKEYSLAETEKLLEKKLEHIGEEKIVTPEAYVSVPAIQAISYSMDNKELRNLYANLLAKSMNVDTKNKVHPSFVEIIKQMSPVDAIVFKNIFETIITPIIDLYIKTPGGGQNYHQNNISWMESASYDIISVSLDNLVRLGLIEIPYGISYTDDNNYEQIRKTTSYIKIKAELEALNKGSVTESKKTIKKTALAYSFYKICVKD